MKPIETKREAIRLLEAGEAYGSVASRLRVGKATVYRWHLRWLESEVEARRRDWRSLLGRG